MTEVAAKSRLVMTVSSFGPETESKTVPGTRYVVVNGTANGVPCVAIVRNEVLDEMIYEVLPEAGDKLAFTGTMTRRGMQAETVAHADEHEVLPEVDAPAKLASSAPVEQTVTEQPEVSKLVMTVTSVGSVIDSKAKPGTVYLVIKGIANDVPCEAVLRNELIDQLIHTVIPAVGDKLAFTGKMTREGIQAETVMPTEEPETVLAPKAPAKAKREANEAKPVYDKPYIPYKNINAKRAAARLAA